MHPHRQRIEALIRAHDELWANQAIPWIERLAGCNALFEIATQLLSDPCNDPNAQ